VFFLGSNPTRNRQKKLKRVQFPRTWLVIYSFVGWLLFGLFNIVRTTLFCLWKSLSDLGAFFFIFLEWSWETYIHNSHQLILEEDLCDLNLNTSWKKILN
jgi:hypothetical protein